jgi:hypothetical protein
LVVQKRAQAQLWQDRILTADPINKKLPLAGSFCVVYSKTGGKKMAGKKN